MTYRYKFDIVRPINRDAVVLKLIRYTVEEDGIDRGAIPLRAEVLTTDGWSGLDAGEMIPDNLPSIDGRELLHAESVMKVLDEFEQHVRGLVGYRAERLNRD